MNEDRKGKEGMKRISYKCVKRKGEKCWVALWHQKARLKRRIGRMWVNLHRMKGEKEVRQMSEKGGGASKKEQKKKWLEVQLISQTNNWLENRETLQDGTVTIFNIKTSPVIPDTWMGECCASCHLKFRTVCSKETEQGEKYLIIWYDMNLFSTAC